MWYVYILRSRDHEWFYVGMTDNLQRRIQEHNEGQTQATKPYAPFEMEAYVGLKTKAGAAALEQYFKTGSGRAFWKKRLAGDA